MDQHMKNTNIVIWTYINHYIKIYNEPELWNGLAWISIVKNTMDQYCDIALSII